MKIIKTFYMPEQWQCTTKEKNSRGLLAQSPVLVLAYVQYNTKEPNPVSSFKKRQKYV